MKAFENSSLKLTITKKSIKITEKYSSVMIGSNEDLTHFKTGVGKIEHNEKTILEKQDLYKKQYIAKRNTKINELSECNDFKTMITLTFEKEENQTEDNVKKNWELASKRLKNRFGKFKYICALERGKVNGHLHFHIITDIDSINNHSKYWNDTGKVNTKWAKNEIESLIFSTSNRSKKLKDKRIELYNEGASFLKVLLGFGHAHIKAIESDEVKYICKYITKDTELNEKYKRTIWSSRNLEKSIKIYSDDVIDYLLENKPQGKYEYSQNSVLWGSDDNCIEIMNIQTLTYTDISDFYYMCQLANKGNEIYLKERMFINTKSYNYTYNLFNPKELRDFNYYSKKYDNKKRKKECIKW